MKKWHMQTYKSLMWIGVKQDRNIIEFHNEYMLIQNGWILDNQILEIVNVAE